MFDKTMTASIGSHALVLGFLLATTAAPTLADLPDFNGDGFDDLAIGAPANNSQGQLGSGLVTVLLGSATGPVAALTQEWHQDVPGVPGGAERGDGFGQALAHGDFNGDGYSDLAIGIPGEDLGATIDAGMVVVLFGCGDGLTTLGAQAWHQNSAGIVGAAEAGDFFGFTVAAGDFDNDGYSDLVVGVPFEAGSAATPRSGAVQVLYGGVNGLSANGNQLWSQGIAGFPGIKEADDFFGYSVATGDFDGDGFDDLAAGAPLEDVGTRRDAGALSVLYGSSTGLTTDRSQVWSQNSPGVRGASEDGDWLGYSLAVGDFNGDDRDDLALGIPLEDLGSDIDTGATIVLFGGTAGLVGPGHRFLSQASPGLPDEDESDDCQGSALATGDFDGDGFDDLVIGTPHEDLAGTDAGVVTVVYGAAGGLPSQGSQLWHQNRPGIGGGNERYDQFGLAVGAGDLNGDGYDDLIVGVPGEDLKAATDGKTRRDTGAVHLIPGDPTGLTGTGSLFFGQEQLGITDSRSNNEWFGYAIP